MLQKTVNNMAGVIPNPSKVNQRAVIQFLSFEGCQAVDIHRRMKAAYGDKCLSRTRVMEWVRMFKDGRELTADLARPGQAHIVATEEAIAVLDKAVLTDRRRSIRSLAEEFHMSIGTAHMVVRKKLNYRKVCSQWVPRMLTDHHKEERMGWSLNHLMRYRAEGDAFLLSIVAGDESWCHHYEPSSKIDSMQWKHPGSPKPKKFKTQVSAGKVMVTAFFDHEGLLLADFKEPGVNISAAHYKDTLDKLHKAIKAKRPGKLSQGVILLHDNARPHVAKIVQETLAKKNWEVLHHPAYSPDLSPCDFHLFGPLKRALKGQRFNSDADVKTAVTTWFREQPRTFFSDGIRRLPKQWDACLNAYGDFF